MSRVDDIERILRNLNRAIADIEGAARDGLFAAALEVEGASKELTPVDTGNLRLSHRTVPTEKGVAIQVEAAYAVYVHEDPDAAHKPPGQWKFLETALQKTDVLGIIKTYAERAIR
jgi:hypothetical protein